VLVPVIPACQYAPSVGCYCFRLERQERVNIPYQTSEKLTPMLPRHLAFSAICRPSYPKECKVTFLQRTFPIPRPAQSHWSLLDYLPFLIILVLGPAPLCLRDYSSSPSGASTNGLDTDFPSSNFFLRLTWSGPLIIGLRNRKPSPPFCSLLLETSPYSLPQICTCLSGSHCRSPCWHFNC